jgi:hypothetical protein
VRDTSFYIGLSRGVNKALKQVRILSISLLSNAAVALWAAA